MNHPLPTERLNIVIAGHVDHGKSTIVGRLLADSGALPDGKLAQVKAFCERNAKPFEYAFVVDALKNEQAQGVTIDSARVFFRAGNREYIFIDSPGHVEFVRNMVTGASRADAALLVIDANEGIRENSRRHGKLLGLLGVRQVVVLVNKMDLVEFGQETFDAVEGEYCVFLREAGVVPMRFIPVCGMRGDNIVQTGSAMGWYSGPTVAGVLGSFRQEESPSGKPFRLWVQGVYKFTNDGDTRRIIAGTVESGSLGVGDRIMFFPSGKKSTVKNIESFPPRSRPTASGGEAIGLTLSEQIYISRGELAIKVGESRPHVTSRLRSSIFWLGREPMVPQRGYLLKIGTARVPCMIETIRSVQDASTLATSESKQLDRYTVADCDLQLDRALAFDLSEDVLGTGRFVIVDEFEIRGGGIIREALGDTQSRMREKVLLRDYKWERSSISAEERAARFKHRPALVVITGKKDSGKKPIARALERDLLAEGYLVYFLGIGNILYGVDADIRGQADVRKEDIRRLAEVAHILLDAGFILIVTAIELTPEELETIHTGIESDQIVTVWRGGGEDGALHPSLSLKESTDVKSAAQQVMTLLRDLGILGKG
jgi:bifunctional enzyme CysN/CysC